MSAIILLIIIGSAVLGIRLWKKKRIFSILLLTPVFLVFCFIGYVVFQESYHTTPDSLDFSIHKEKDMYVVEGEWNDRLDGYRFPTDFLVVHIPKGEAIQDLKRKRILNYKEITASPSFKETIQTWLKNEGIVYPDSEVQVYDIETSEQFKFSFKLPDNVKPEDVKIYYAHTKEEPMSSLEFWFKEIKLN